ncbi:MAG: DEAD/DEAH box helicase family protein [Spirochaetes bacterium]|nr:DEAD/DEAH box helicase family protein [Spirochaetota bacterium]
MAYIKFGYTWWGSAWLNSLNNIDYSNRLPRGQRYARNGSVLSIGINRNRVKAKVKGRRPSPYSVSITLPAFKKIETDKITDTILSSPLYLSKLESGILPTELLDVLRKQKIKLFPSSWEDMQAHCSCPDWAVPCKHIAAVIYLISNEIDKNPFIIFNLHDYDILKAIKPDLQQQKYNTSIPDLADMLGKNKTEIGGNHGRLGSKSKKSGKIKEQPDSMQKSSSEIERLKSIDFSKIPEMFDSLSKLFIERPLFCLENDFKKIIMLHYKKTKKAVEQFLNENNFLNYADSNQKNITVNMDIKKDSFKIKGELKGDFGRLKTNSENIMQLLDILKGYPLNRLDEYPQGFAFLDIVYSFSLSLMEKSAYIPDIISIAENKYIIRWIPARFNSEINKITNILTDSLHGDLITYNNRQLKIKDQVLFLVSYFIGSFISLIKPVKDSASNKLLSLFFNSTPFKPDKFEEMAIPETIHLWLSRLSIVNRKYVPVIKIEEGNKADKLMFSILVENREEAPQPYPLKEHLLTHKKDKFTILKDIGLLSAYLPEVDIFLSRNSDKPVEVSSDSFVKVWFSALPVLRVLGINSLLPKSLKEVFIPSLSLSFKKSPVSGKKPIVSCFSLFKLLDFNWSIAVGKDHLSPAEFKALLNKYSGIVKFKEIYIYINDREAGRILKQLEKEPKLTPTDILRINLEGKYKDVIIKTDDELKQIFKEMFKVHSVAIPVGLNAVLRPYQLRGYRWLYNNFKTGLGSLIADDMGLGKTIQVITMLLKLKEESLFDGKTIDRIGTKTGGRTVNKKGRKKALIVVPATLLTNWKREMERFAPSLSASIYHGQGRIFSNDADIILTTYSLVRSELDTFKANKWLCVIIDEAQNIKNPLSSQSKAVKAIKSNIKIAMTGTPLENRLTDYWSIFDFTMKGLLGNHKSFIEKYAVPIERFQSREELASLKAVTSPFIIRREKTDRSIINDLPDKIEIDEYTTLTHEQAALYKEFTDNIYEIVTEADGISRKGIIFKLISGLKQICDHPVLFLKKGNPEISLSGKSILLMELIKKILDANEKAIIFSQYREMGYLLQAMIKNTYDMDSLFLHGGIPRKKRDILIDSFQENRESRIMVLSLKAGGTGLNLTAARNVIHYDLWWNPAVENQATDRAYRIGQKKNVKVYRFITKSTFEEKIQVMLESKKKLADLSVNTGEKWITELSDSELKQLISLD